MGFGFCGKIIRVDLSKSKVNVESLGETIFRDYLSGSGIAAKILSQEYDNSFDPFDANSPIVFMAGLLTGTPVPAACKASFCARSPQTEIWDEATVGGYWGAELKFTGHDGIVVTGRAEKPVYLWIDDDEIYIKSAQSIWGLDTYLTTNKLLEATDSKARVACIGQAGENLCRMASVMIDGRESRAAARGGLGAAMGSKMLKAIVVRGSKRPSVKEKEKLPRRDTSLEKLSSLRPIFKRGGTVTAGNASGINDGAAALVLMKEEKAKEFGLSPLAHLRAWESAGIEPELFGMGPVPAVKRLLNKENVNIEHIDLFEINEAFASSTIAVMRELKINPQKVNPNGGAIALGHPVGATGVIIMIKLINEMRRRKSKYGIAAMCVGSGQGMAVMIEV